jgi:hypothetical protein
VGNSKKVASAEVEVDADKDLVGVTKKLLKSKEWTAVKSFDTETSNWVKNRSVPSMFRKGVSLVKMDFVEAVETYLNERVPQREALVQAFMEVYEAQKTEAELHLRSLYNLKDYPPRAAVESRFYFEWSWIMFSVPGKLKEISAGFFKMEQAKAAAKWENATENAKLLLRAQMKKLVDHLVDRMTPGEDGKRKTFQKTTVSNLTEYLENFSVRNVTSDAELEYLVEQSKKLLNGADPELLRKNDVDADCLAKGFSTVKQFLDTMVQDAGSRKITFSEESDEDSPDDNPFGD